MSDSRYDKRDVWNDPAQGAARAGARPERGDDPLAELAKLIDEDPFADFERRRGEPAANHEDDGTGSREPQIVRHDVPEPSYPDEHDAESQTPPGSDASQSQAEQRNQFEQTSMPHVVRRVEPGPTPARETAPRNFDAAAALEAQLFGTGALESDPTPSSEAPRRDEEPAETQADPYAGFAQPANWSPSDDDHAEPEISEYSPSSDGFEGDPGRQDYAAYAQAEEDRFYAEGAPVYADDGHMPPPEGYEYDEEPSRSRRGLAVVGALVGVVVFGGAAVLAYRAFVGDSSGPPPVIRADASPTKVAPQDQGEGTSEPPAGKLVYDRVGGESADGEERLVSREEPVFDVEGRDGDVRVINTNNPDQQVGPRGGAGADGESAADEIDAPNQPRRVRTVVVRPDGTIVAPSEAPAVGSNESASVEPPAAPPAQAAALADSASSQPEQTGQSNSIPIPEPSPVARAQAGQQGQAAAAEQPAPQPASAAPKQASQSNGQPLQLVPSGTQRPAQSQSSQETQVAAAPVPTEPSQSQPATQIGAFPAGSYVVQVASTRSEDEARSTANTVRQRYAEVISGYQPAIERADLGDRGIFYRVGLGPVGSQSDANLLCEQLKSSGLDCFVRRN